jgi:hypothetical protein
MTFGTWRFKPRSPSECCLFVAGGMQFPRALRPPLAPADSAAPMVGSGGGSSRVHPVLAPINPTASSSASLLAIIAPSGAVPRFCVRLYLAISGHAVSTAKTRTLS